MSEGSRILLVEDDPGLAEEILRGLRRENWTVDHVGSLAIAFEAVMQANYRAILLDRRLPDGDGLELVEWIQREVPGTPVAVITAHGSVEAAVRALHHGA